jgi:hypothetical protein
VTKPRVRSIIKRRLEVTEHIKIKKKVLFKEVIKIEKDFIRVNKILSKIYISVEKT